MIDLNQIHDEMQKDIDAVSGWAQDIYMSSFADHFADQNKFYRRMKSSIDPITDEELESILTWVPLELFKVSESLSQLKISEEVVRLRTKEKESEIISASLQTSESKKKEEAANAVIGNKIMIAVYEAVEERVSREISASRELIMGCKKIWDSRRASENSNPVGTGSVDSNLPEYSCNSSASSKQSYIR